MRRRERSARGRGAGWRPWVAPCWLRMRGAAQGRRPTPRSARTDAPLGPRSGASRSPCRWGSCWRSVRWSPRGCGGLARGAPRLCARRMERPERPRARRCLRRDLRRKRCPQAPRRRRRRRRLRGPRPSARSRGTVPRHLSAARWVRLRAWTIPRAGPPWRCRGTVGRAALGALVRGPGARRQARGPRAAHLERSARGPLRPHPRPSPCSIPRVTSRAFSRGVRNLADSMRSSVTSRSDARRVAQSSPGRYQSNVFGKARRLNATLMDGSSARTWCQVPTGTKSASPGSRTTSNIVAPGGTKASGSRLE